MLSAIDAINDASNEGPEWDEDSKLLILADFIDSLGPAVAKKLDKYLTKRVEQERAMGGDE